MGGSESFGVFAPETLQRFGASGLGSGWVLGVAVGDMIFVCVFWLWGKPPIWDGLPVFALNKETPGWACGSIDCSVGYPQFPLRPFLTNIAFVGQLPL